MKSPRKVETVFLKPSSELEAERLDGTFEQMGRRLRPLFVVEPVKAWAEAGGYYLVGVNLVRIDFILRHCH